MARVSAPQNYFTFVGGKVSDSNPLLSTPNVGKVVRNVDIDKSGKVARRLGLDFEDRNSTSADPEINPLQNTSIDMWEWHNPADERDLHFIVVRIGIDFYVYNQNSSPLVDGYLQGDPAEVTSFDAWQSDILFDVTLSREGSAQAAFGRGKMFVAMEGSNPFEVTYNPSNGYFTTRALDMKKRDFEGVDDGLSITHRPTTLSNEHKYNLLNQGWSNSRINSFKSSTGVYPSNADIEHLGFKTNTDGDKVWSASEILNHSLGNTRAPQGHYILDAFKEDRSAVSGVSGLTVVENTDRPAAIAFYAGRVWVGSSGGDVFFSQILTSDDSAGKAHQEQDPSSEEFNELLDNDGGVIPLSQAGKVNKFMVLGDLLTVYADAGVWTISGGGGDGFTANLSKVDKVSNISVRNPKAVVEAEGVNFFWAEDGIYVLQPDQVSGRLTAQNLTEGRISEDYRAIPLLGRERAQGCYDNSTRRIYWSFHNTQNDASKDQFRFNAMLIYDLSLNAFWDYTISNPDAPIPKDEAGEVSEFFIGGCVKPTGKKEDTSSDQVFVGTDAVLKDALNVVISNTSSGFKESPLKVLMGFADGVPTIHFGEFVDRNFADWRGFDAIQGGYAGEAFTSTVETTPETLNEASLDGQAQYLFTFHDYQRLEDSAVDPLVEHGCKVTARWGWTMNDETGRWSNPQQTYKFRRYFIPDDAADPFNDGFEVRYSKLKIRGHGHALTLHYESESGKDFILLGWSVPHTKETTR